MQITQIEILFNNENIFIKYSDLSKKCMFYN